MKVLEVYLHIRYWVTALMLTMLLSCSIEGLPAQSRDDDLISLTWSIPHCPHVRCAAVVSTDCARPTYLWYKGLCRGCDENMCPECPKVKCPVLNVPGHCIKPSYIWKNGKKCKICDRNICETEEKY